MLSLYARTDLNWGSCLANQATDKPRLGRERVPIPDRLLESITQPSFLCLFHVAGSHEQWNPFNFPSFTFLSSPFVTRPLISPPISSLWDDWPLLMADLHTFIELAGVLNPAWCFFSFLFFFLFS